MVAFVIFWIAVFAIICFTLEIVFRGLASALDALVESASVIISLIVIVFCAEIGLALIFELTDVIIQEGMQEALKIICFLILEFVIIAALFGGLGRLLLNIASNILHAITEIIVIILDCIADKFGLGYEIALIAIGKRINKY